MFKSSNLVYFRLPAQAFLAKSSSFLLQLQHKQRIWPDRESDRHFCKKLLSCQQIHTVSFLYLCWWTAVHTSDLLQEIYNRLLGHFGPQNWWPAETPFEVMVGAILTQNTNWQNVEKAIANLKAADLLSMVGLEGIEDKYPGELSGKNSAGPG